MSVTWVDIVVIIFALGLGVVGYWRGFRRELFVTLAGVVLGVVFGSLWGPVWGRSLAERLQGEQALYQGLIQLIGLLFVVLVVGYGSSIFLPRTELKKVWPRLAGVLVGLFNGLLVAAFSLQYIQDAFLKPDSLLERSPISSYLMVAPRWALLAVVVGMFVAVVAVGLYRLFRYASRLTREVLEAQPAPEPAKPTPAPPPAETLPATEPFTPPGEPTMAPPPAGPEAAAEEEPTVPCPNCSQPVPFGAVYCPHCGKIVS